MITARHIQLVLHPGGAASDASNLLPLCFSQPTALDLRVLR